ncbi:hypothetical protein D3C79_905830 [compost metagenome]
MGVATNFSLSRLARSASSSPGELAGQCMSQPKVRANWALRPYKVSTLKPNETSSGLGPGNGVTRGTTLATSALSTNRCTEANSKPSSEKPVNGILLKPSSRSSALERLLRA